MIQQDAAVSDITCRSTSINRQARKTHGKGCTPIRCTGCRSPSQHGSRSDNEEASKWLASHLRGESSCLLQRKRGVYEMGTSSDLLPHAAELGRHFRAKLEAPALQNRFDQSAKRRKAL